MNSPCTRSINPDAALNQTGLFISIALSDQGTNTFFLYTILTRARPLVLPPPLIFSCIPCHQDP